MGLHVWDHTSGVICVVLYMWLYYLGNFHSSSCVTFMELCSRGHMHRAIFAYVALSWGQLSYCFFSDVNLLATLSRLYCCSVTVMMLLLLPLCLYFCDIIYVALLSRL